MEQQQLPEPATYLAAAPPIPRRSRERDRIRNLADQQDENKKVETEKKTSGLTWRQTLENHRRDPNRTPERKDKDPRTDHASAAAASIAASLAASANNANHNRDRDPNQPIQTASPEVISSLITSLSSISRPLSTHFESPFYLESIGPNSPIDLSFNSSPTAKSGSFGVDYGAFSKPSETQWQHQDVPVDQATASPPVVRTGRSRPTSKISVSSKGPKSPKSPAHTREPSGFRSLLSRGSSSALSRSSSKASLASGVESIGKLSIERGSEPVSPVGTDPKPLRRQKSADSWNWRTAGRSQRGLMYMSSKERLREQEIEKRTSVIGISALVASSFTGLVGTGTTSGSSTPRLDPLSVESIISEEPGSDIPSTPKLPTDWEPPSGFGSSPPGIPTRESSLRRSQKHKRSSTRTSRKSIRESDTGANDTIHELEEHPSELPEPRTEKPQRRQRKMLDPLRLSADLHMKPVLSTPTVNMFPETETDEVAPSPAIAQSRPQDRDADPKSKRRSAFLNPDSLVGNGDSNGNSDNKNKRASSKLKRLSDAIIPGNPDKSSSTEGIGPHVTYERPKSADSIDDTVEAYLCSPRLSQKIRHPQTGRVISFSEVGDPNGSAVFCCVGMGLTRYITAFYDELALTLKLRMITPDRPGVGDSEPYSDGNTTPLGWPDDVYAICQALKITKFSILAHSAGAIYALATALRMPQHIRGKIHLLAPWIPPSQINVIGGGSQNPLPPTNAIPTSQKILRALPTPILKVANSNFMAATSSSITSSLPKQKRAKRDKKKDKSSSLGIIENKDSDRPATSSGIISTEPSGADEDMDRIRPTITNSNKGIGGGSHRHRHTRSKSSNLAGVDEHNNNHSRHSTSGGLSDADVAAALALAERERQQQYDHRLTHAIWQLATTGANPAVDLLVCLERRHTIGFRYVDIARPVVIHHGSRDTRVPVENVKWLGKMMRRCEVRILEGEGHGLMASAQVMAGVLMEISKEWEDWGRVTGQNPGVLSERGGAMGTGKGDGSGANGGKHGHGHRRGTMDRLGMSMGMSFGLGGGGGPKDT
ncbi:alpha/beta-hydrolase [Neurospora crassa]|uniref:Hydrolase n=1 Tax=Neurospora crassa (strain ATCC 24698 / 74-OR23-1A / CBS 708.71 / DSM 1257 / FGSC 987) TaxID=367110 RepID=Q7SA08_NEUCR|nr:hydrolase [Neurospora crassa OR74A]EAA33189.3 hydrolase [Neurospora crassa OR74A]KHE85866.1 alpha/beta-hydrolase [Neurospora crassa]|eukprot:XP_962425.3 hydrolase [Neurospora crassa OR74A]